MSAPGLYHYLLVSGALFMLGLVGVATRRNALMMLLAIELMLNAANVAFVAFSRFRGDVAGQTAAFLVMTVSAAEVTVGLAILVALFRARGTVDADRVTLLKW